jgi:dTDP-4-dehydrorhamnose 3,5-epimerase-like enzyme
MNGNGVGRILSDDVLVQLNLMGIKEIEIHSFIDNRGFLGVLSGISNIPFEAKRLFFLKNVPPGQVRGQHAHKNCRQLVVPLSGDCLLKAERGGMAVSLHTSEALSGLLFPAFTWLEISNFTSDCVLLVLADMEYDEADYLLDYEDFRNKGRDVN